MMTTTSRLLHMVSQYLYPAILFPDKALEFIIYKVKEPITWDYTYAGLRSPKLKSEVSYNDPKVQDEIVRELKAKGFDVVDLIINVGDYKEYLRQAEYSRFPYYHITNPRFWIEKTLEHYLAAKLLNLSSQDVYIDVASAASPSAEIYRQLYGCKIYRQDLAFPEGIKGNIIGGSADNMPVPDGFATKIALHCSFEHFEGDLDIRFIKEASRVLRKGGKLCILPLYLNDQYGIRTDPAMLPINGRIAFESEATLFCVRGSGQRHGRFYDVSHLVTRIKDSLQELKLTLFVIQNPRDVDPGCYVKFAAVFEKE